MGRGSSTGWGGADVESEAGGGEVMRKSAICGDGGGAAGGVAWQKGVCASGGRMFRRLLGRYGMRACHWQGNVSQRIWRCHINGKRMAVVWSAAALWMLGMTWAGGLTRHARPGLCGVCTGQARPGMVWPQGWIRRDKGRGKVHTVGRFFTGPASAAKRCAVHAARLGAARPGAHARPGQSCPHPAA